MVQYSCEALLSQQMLRKYAHPNLTDEDFKKLDEEKELKKLWIGVDMDGTLAKYDGWKGWDHFGEPIKPVVDKIHAWSKRGVLVCIFTARMSEVSLARSKVSKEQMQKVIDDWCVKHIGYKLPCKTEKDCYMLAFLDDSAIQISKNQGMPESSGGMKVLNDQLDKLGDKVIKARRCYSLSLLGEDGKVSRSLRSPSNTIQWWLTAWRNHTGNDIVDCKFKVWHHILGDIGVIDHAVKSSDGSWEYNWTEGGPVL